MLDLRAIPIVFLFLAVEALTASPSLAADSGTVSAPISETTFVPLLPPDFPTLVRQYDAKLATIATEQDALAFYTGTLDALIGTKAAPALAVVPRQKPRPSEDKTAGASVLSNVQPLAVQLVQELVVWRFSSHLRQAAEQAQPLPALRTVLMPDAPQRAWIVRKDSHPSLVKAVSLGETLIAVIEEIAGVPALPPSPLPPLAIGIGGSSWLSLVELQGTDALRAELRSRLDSAGISAAERDPIAAHIVQTQIAPVLTAHLIATTIRAEGEAEFRLRQLWRELASIQGKADEGKAWARLCGTWQWTIHNHQHHAENKATMVFSPPDSGPLTQPRPTRMIAAGDTVYLRWDFPGGFQEDSLLFAGEGQRLEGTFINTRGPWGSITGKRISGCPRSQ